MLELSTKYNLDDVFMIVSNPVLFNCTYGHGGQSLTKNQLDDKKWLLIKEDQLILGCFEIRALTKVTIEAHIFVLPKYWSRTIEIVDAAHKWAVEEGYKTCFTSVPANCIHMLKFIQRIKYEACGQIPNGIVYHNKLVTLFLFQKQL